MAGEFEDLIPSQTPAATATGVFDDLLPETKTKGGGAFDDLVPPQEDPREELKRLQAEAPRTTAGTFWTDPFLALEKGMAGGIGAAMKGTAAMRPPGATKAQTLQEIQASPLYRTGQQLTEQGQAVEAPADSLLNKAAEAAGGFVPLLLTGPGAPLAMGHQAAADALETKFAQAKEQGAGDEAAADQALRAAAATGLTQTALWAALPAGMKTVLSKATGLAGEGAVRQFLARRAAAAVEGGTLGAVTQLAQNVETGRPAGQGVGASALGLAAMQVGLPWKPELERAGVPTAAEPAKAADGNVSEFGGEAAVPAAEPAKGTFDDLIPAEPVPAAAEAAPRSTTVLADKKMYPVIELPVKDLQLSEDVPNFKANANAQTGVVAGQQLEGDYERLGTGAVAVYERLDGRKEVISGRHRFDLAKRGGEETIPAQIVREADGFTPAMAMTLDAEMNIRDGQGTVGDYANYFRNSAVSEAEARQRGLLSRAKGQDGWTLGRHATTDLYALYRAGKITEPQAVAIAGAAPGEAGLQRVGSQAALRGAGAQELGNFVQAVRLETKSLRPEQFDLFAADDSAIQAAEQMAKVASRIQGELSREIRATDTAARNATTAKAKGLSFDRPPEEMLAENAQLKGERARWDNWALHPELVQQVRDYAAMQRSVKEGPKAKAQSPKPAGTFDDLIPTSKVAGVIEPKETAADKRTVAQKQVEESVRQEKNKRLAGIQVYEVDSEGGPTWAVSSGDADRSWTVYEWDGKWIAESNGSVEYADTRAEAIDAAKARVADEVNHGKTTFGANMDNTYALQPLFEHFDVPEGVTQRGWFRTKWGSWYNYLELEDGKELKISIRDHEASRKDMGTPDKAVEVSKEWSPSEVNAALGKLEKWVEKKANAGPANETGVAGIKTSLETQSQSVPPGPTVAGTQADKGNVSALQPGKASALTEQGKPQFSESVKPTLEQRLDALKIDTGGGKLLEGVTGLPIHLWNESINIIKLGVSAGKALAAAVEDGIAWLKANHPGSVFDADEYRRAVDREFGVRDFGQKLQADPDVAAAAKTGIAEYVYEKRENETDLQAAQRLVAAHGIDGGMRLYQDERVAMPGAVRTMLGKHLVKAIGAEERLARSRGDTAGADALLSKQVELADLDLKRSTDIAQSLQAMSVYGDMTPAGMLQHARRVFGDAAQRLKDKVQPVLDQLRGGFREANAQAVAGTIADPDVNGAARSAVDAHIAGSEATRRGVVAEVAGAFAESPEIVRQAREALRGQLNKLLQPRGPGMANPAKAALGDVLGDTAKRAAGIAAAHYQGAELGKTLAEKLQERLGLSADAAGRLAKSLDLKFAEMVEAARKRIPERVAPLRARQATPFDPNEFAQSGLDREIRRQLRELNLKLGELVKRHGVTADATGRSIGERVVKDAGLTGPRAEAMQKAFDQRFTELATAQKRRLVEQLGRARVTLPRKVQSELGKLIELTNVGAFDDRRFSAELTKRLDLPEVTPELAREITRRANDVQATPEGFQRDRASVRLLNFIAQQRGVHVWELPLAMWYANILSGVTTPVHVMVDNLGGLAGNTLVSLLRQPGALGQAAPALARGFSKGALQSLEILKTGIVTGVKSQLHTSQTLELNPFRGVLSALNFWKYPGRVLAATHVLTFKPAMEVKQSLAARAVARSEGLRGQALTQRVADLLANTDERVNAARAQAAGEGLTGLDLRRRTAELLEQQREQAMPGSTEVAREYGLRATYLNDPYGVIGHVVNGLNTVIEGIGSDHSRMGFVPKLVVPFTRIIGNLINEKLNWSPVGAFRAGRGMQSGELYGKPITDPTAAGDLLTKSIVGTAAMSALAAASAQYLNDPDPKFAITGNGPSGPGARKQLEAAGWRPHAVKLGGMYVDYLRTPLAVPLAVLGNYLDALRYRHFDQADALNRATFVLKGTADTIVHQSFLDSVAKLFEVVGNENTKTGGEQLARTLARGGAAFVVPNLVMQADRLFDPTRYDDTGVTALVRAQVPFARRLNKPVINVLGDPVKFGVFDHDLSATKPDALWRVLAEKQAWVPEPGRDTIVGDRKRGPDYFRALTPAELYDYTRESGQRIRDRLEANLDHIRDLEPDQAKAYVQKVTEEERTRARKGYTP